MGVYAYLSAGAHRGKKSVLELEEVVSCLPWMLGTQLDPLKEKYTLFFFI